MYTPRNGRPADRPRMRRPALACQLYASRICRVEFENQTKVRERRKEKQSWRIYININDI